MRENDTTEASPETRRRFYWLWLTGCLVFAGLVLLTAAIA